MDHSKECPTITLLMLLYVADTILMYVALKGNNWVTYDGGNSGLWNNCNTTRTGTVDNGSTTNSTEEENCDYIYMTEASASLHHVRAFFIIGFICWCLGMIQRYLTWQHRGTKVDKQIIFLALICSLSVFLSAFLFTAFVQKEYLEDSFKYANTHFGVDHTLAFVGASLASLLVFVSIRHHTMLNSANSTSWAKHCPCFRPGSRLISCCSKTDTRPHAASQQTSRHTSRHPSSTDPSSGSTTLDISVISTDTSDNSPRRSSQPHSSLQRSLVLLGAVLSVRRATARSEHPGSDRRPSVDESGIADSAGDVSVVPASGISEWSNRRGRHNMPPVGVIALPPAYDDIIGDSFVQNNGVNPPPSYDEVIGNRELILTPPPAYQESNG